MIDCKRFAELLDSYIDGDISSADKAGCYEHMSKCASCKADHEYTKSVYDALHTLPAPEIPVDFLADINKKIDEGAFERKDTRVRRIIRNPGVYSAVAAGLALAVIVGSSPWKLIRDAEKEPVNIDLPVTDRAASGNREQNDKPDKDKLPKPTAEAEIPAAPSERPAVAEPEQPAASSSPAGTPEQTQAPKKTRPAAVPKPQTDQYAGVKKTTAPQATARPVQPKPTAQATAKPEPQPVSENTAAPQKTEPADQSKTPDVKYIPADKDIAVPSEAYKVSDESDAANAAKIEHNSKLKESYALVESVDNMVYSPDVQQRLENNDNIVVNDAVYVEAIQGDTNALSSSIMVSREDMEAVNKALEVFNFPQDDRCYFMTNEQLHQFLRTLDNLGVEYRHNAVNEDKQVVLKLITT